MHRPTMSHLRLTVAGPHERHWPAPPRPATLSPSSASHRLPVPSANQGLTLLHFSAQRKHILWDTLGA